MKRRNHMIEHVNFTHDETEKVKSVLGDFGESFCRFAMNTDLPKKDAHLLLQGAMMAFSTFSCIEPIATMMIYGLLMDRIYGTKEE